MLNLFQCETELGRFTRIFVHRMFRAVPRTVQSRRRLLTHKLDLLDGCILLDREILDVVWPSFIERTADVRWLMLLVQSAGEVASGLLLVCSICCVFDAFVALAALSRVSAR